MKPVISLIALTLAVASASVWAGGTAVIESGTGNDKEQTRIEYDGSKLRMDSSDKDEGYMLVRDGRVYSVSIENGQAIVIDMASMGKMLGAMAQQDLVGVDKNVGRFLGLDDTGRSETVAGIAGRVYVATYIDSEGRKVSEEMVLARDRRVHELTGSMRQMSLVMAQAFGVEPEVEAEKLMREALDKGNGVLRFGTDFRLVSINDTTPPASRFALPAQPQKMPDLGSILRGAGAGGSATDPASSGNNLLEGLLKGNIGR